MSRWLFAAPYLFASLLIGFAGCSDDDEGLTLPTANGNGNGGDGADSGAIMLSVDFDGTVAEENPLIVEVKEDQEAGPTRSVEVPAADTTITISDLPADTGWVVAVFHDEDGDGQWDDVDEPLVFYNKDSTGQAVGPTSDPTTITVDAGDTIDIGTIAFGEDVGALPGNGADTGSISLTVNFTDSVGEDNPLIVEVKESQPSAPTIEVVLASADTTITISNVSTATTWVVAIYHDVNNNGEWDSADEPLVYYNEDATGQAVGPTEDATEIAITPGATVELGTITFVGFSDSDS
ncbi:MAG: hypothetical protein GF344_13530 [Chitinivibrionales bacterium]|nr:hypothetical protein [Chitinivibrionales bacterium]MBD3357752.1 hypothetical protein [Chitinivibrionales bacterium]